MIRLWLNTKLKEKPEQQETNCCHRFLRAGSGYVYVYILVLKQFSYLYVYASIFTILSKHSLHLIEGHPFPFTAVHFYSVNLYLCSQDQNKVVTFWDYLVTSLWFSFCSKFWVYILCYMILECSHHRRHLEKAPCLLMSAYQSQRHRPIRSPHSRKIKRLFGAVTGDCVTFQKNKISCHIKTSTAASLLSFLMVHTYSQP